MARTAVIAGVGPGLGESLARTFATEGLSVGLLARSEGYLESLADDLRETDGDAVAVPCDLGDPDDIAQSYLHLVEQDPSAWTLELDLRPHVEEF